MISPHENKIYKQKYSSIKKLIKKFVYENAALCDQVYQLQEKIICLKEERNYLLKRSFNLDSSGRSNAEQLDSTIFMQKTASSNNISKAGALKRAEPTTEKIKSRRATSSGIKRKTLLPVPVDSSGLPVFPVVIGSLSVHSLGEIVTDRLGYHDDDLLYPVGYCSSRMYGLFSDPTTPCIYTCMILDGGPSPLFQIDCDSEMDPSITGDDINAVHAELLRRINESLGVEVVSTRGRGADFFGISHPTVLNLLQSSAGIKKCVNYKMTKFEINRSGEPYAEENDASLTFECLQRSITFSRSHMEEMDQQETLDSTTTLRDLLNS